MIFYQMIKTAYPKSNNFEKKCEKFKKWEGQ